MECIVVAPTAIALASSSTNCSVKYTGAAADRNGCLSWKVAKCTKKEGKEICGSASSDRCLSCAEGDVLVPVSTVAHGKDLDRVIGALCYFSACIRREPWLLLQVTATSTRPGQKA